MPGGLLPFADFAMIKIESHRCILPMRPRARSLAFLSLPIFLLSGCSDDANKGAKSLYSQASQALESSKTGQKSHAEVLVSYKTAKDRIERILREYPSSEIAVGLSSGGTTISGLTLDQFRGLEATLNELAEAERSPLACALLIADSMETASGKSEVLAEIASKVAKNGNKELAVELLSQALDGIKTMKDTPLLDEALAAAKPRTHKDAYQKSAVLGKIAGKYAEIGDFTHAVETAKMIRKISDSKAKSGALAESARRVVEIGEKEQASRLLSQALGEARTIEDSLVKTWSLTGIALEYQTDGQKDLSSQLFIEALGAAKTIADADDKFCEMDTIATRYLENGDLMKALDVGLSMEDAEWIWRTWALSDIAGKVAQLDEKDKAALIDVTRAIKPWSEVWK